MAVYGYNNFRLEIVEYWDRSNVIKVDIYYIDRCKPEYYRVTKKGYSLNFKHSKQILDKFKYPMLSVEALYKLKKKKKRIAATLAPLAKAN